MHVLHVVANMDARAGGPGRCVEQLTSVMRAEGITVAIAGRHAAGRGAIALEHLPVPFHIPTRASERLIAHAVTASDIVHIHGVWNGTVSATAYQCRRAAVPYVISPHGMLDPICIGHHRLRKGLYRFLIERKTIDGVSGLHFLSDEERARARFMPALPPDRIAVAPNGAPPVDSSKVPPGTLMRRFPALAGRRVLVYLGRLDAIKGIDLQLAALALMPEAERPALLIVGPDFGDERRLRAMAQRLRLEPWLTWAGAVYGEERLALLGEADAVLLTSAYDCNPVVIPEALAMGGIVIATDTCGGSEAAAREGAAIVVRREAAALAQAIATVLQDDARSAAMRAAARAYAARHLRAADLIEPLLRLYERVSARRVPKRTRATVHDLNPRLARRPSLDASAHSR